MKIRLAIDTTTEACSVAISKGEKITEKYVVAPRRHGELVLQMVDDLLGQSSLRLRDVDQFVINCGPGAFTGVRMGLSVVQGLAYAVSKPVLTVNSLQILAWGVCLNGARQTNNSAHKNESLKKMHIAVAMDARLNQIYGQFFSLENGQLIEQTPAVVTSVENLPVPDVGLTAETLCAGTAWSVYAEKFEQRFNHHFSAKRHCLYPRASWAIQYVNSQKIEPIAAEMMTPIYLRDRVAQTTKERNQRR